MSNLYLILKLYSLDQKKIFLDCPSVLKLHSCRDGPALQLVLDLSVKKPWANCWAEGIGRTSRSLEEKKTEAREGKEFPRLLMERR